ncbi:DNA glycosylase [Amylocystis lapponica]|nr:DNA glycosylase [Amylocystis lapponica]
MHMLTENHTGLFSPYFKHEQQQPYVESDSNSLESSAYPDSNVLTSSYFSLTALDASQARSKSPVYDVFETSDYGGDISTSASGLAAGLKTEYRALRQNPGFRHFCLAFMSAYKQLYMAKPILIQEYVAHDHWKVLIAVSLLNKTAGKHAVPAFFSIVDMWPTPQAMSEAFPDALENVIKHLGLGKSRSHRIIALSQAYLSDPPTPARLRPSKCYLNVRVQADDDELSSIVRRRYPPTPVSHLPGSGPYALDSYRIFCNTHDEWKAVMPNDKELVKYLKWKWAVVELRRWDPLCGPGDKVDLDYLQDLIVQLS